MNNEQLNIVNYSIALGSSVINSDYMRGVFSRFGTSFRKNPHFCLQLMTHLMLTNTEFINWLNNDGYQAYALAINEFSIKAKQAPPDYNTLCSALITGLQSEDDICSNTIVASAISSFFSDGAGLGKIHLNRVMDKSDKDILFAFVEDRLWALLYSALWNCDFEGFRQMALAKIE